MRRPASNGCDISGGPSHLYMHAAIKYVNVNFPNIVETKNCYRSEDCIDFWF